MIVHRDLQQGTPEWFAARTGMATASNFHKILTAKGALEAKGIGPYINDLIGQAFAPEEQDEFQGNRWTDRGHELEPLAREAFIQRTGHAVEQVGFVTLDDRTAGCSPDGLLVCEGQYVGGLEIKCPARATHVSYVCGGVLPDKYKQQVHGSLVVTGLPEWHFWSWHPAMEPLHVVVTWTDYTRTLRTALREFAAMYAEAWKYAEPKLTPKN